MRLRSKSSPAASRVCCPRRHRPLAAAITAPARQRSPRCSCDPWHYPPHPGPPRTPDTDRATREGHTRTARTSRGGSVCAVATHASSSPPATPRTEEAASDTGTRSSVTGRSCCGGSRRRSRRSRGSSCHRSSRSSSAPRFPCCRNWHSENVADATARTLRSPQRAPAPTPRSSHAVRAR